MNVLSKLKVALAVAMTSSLDQICVLMCSASNHNSLLFEGTIKKHNPTIADSFATQCLEIKVS
jgi:nicotinamide mononucleotide adenylyltransferase